MVDWLPQMAQDFLYYNPLTHPYEMIRAGFFGDVVEAHYDPMVSLVWSLVLLAPASGRSKPCEIACMTHNRTP